MREQIKVFILIGVVAMFMFIGIQFLKLQSAYNAGSNVYQIEAYDPSCKCWESYFTNSYTSKNGFLEFRSSMGIQYQISSLNTRITKLK